MKVGAEHLLSHRKINDSMLLIILLPDSSDFKTLVSGPTPPLNCIAWLNCLIK
jgi:hypothetical protein